MRWKSIAITFLCLAATTAGAQVNRCKDSSGKTIYSDQPCAVGQTGGQIERQRTRREIERDRAQAELANEKKHQARAADLQRQLIDAQQVQQRPVATPAPQNLAASPQCREARKEMEFVSSIRTLSQDEKRMRVNAAITNVNAACGTNTALMQEPKKTTIIHQSQPTNCVHTGGPFISCN